MLGPNCCTHESQSFQGMQFCFLSSHFTPGSMKWNLPPLTMDRSTGEDNGFRLTHRMANT